MNTPGYTGYPGGSGSGSLHSGGGDWSRPGDSGYPGGNGSGNGNGNGAGTAMVPATVLGPGRETLVRAEARCLGRPVLPLTVGLDDREASECAPVSVLQGWALLVLRPVRRSRVSLADSAPEDSVLVVLASDVLVLLARAQPAWQAPLARALRVQGPATPARAARPTSGAADEFAPRIPGVPRRIADHRSQRSACAAPRAQLAIPRTQVRSATLSKTPRGSGNETLRVRTT